MRRISLTEQPVDLNRLLELAQEGPVIVLAPNGKEYVFTEADQFEQEVEELRTSVAFQQFLDSRSAKGKPRRSLSEVAQEVEAEIAAQERNGQA
jgi:hypothetical protein